MPFDLGNNPPYLILRSGLIAEASIMAPHMVRRAVNRVDQKMGFALLDNYISFEMDSVKNTFCFRELGKLSFTRWVA